MKKSREQSIARVRAMQPEHEQVWRQDCVGDFYDKLGHGVMPKAHQFLNQDELAMSGGALAPARVVFTAVQ